MIRDFKENIADYRRFIDLFYKTDFSYKKGVPSKLGRYVNPESIPSYSSYLYYISNDYKMYYKSFTDIADNVIGGIEYTRVADSAIVTHFFILPKYQLRGCGRKFYNEFQNHLRSIGILQVNLATFSTGSMLFWQKLGFITDSNPYRYYKLLK